jgi:protocatechuate 3,4-dioxygenase beta subunit
MTRDEDDRMWSRRSVLSAFGALGAVVAVGCTERTPGNPDASAGADAAGGGGGSADAATPGTCATIPSETAGPYPDKTGMLGNATYNRKDITEGKPGLPLTVQLTVVKIADGCAPVAGVQVEVWHCDADGHYSEYAGQPGGYDGTGTTYLRGVQTTDANGTVTFTTIYPGWYQGRATHIHLEVFQNGAGVKTSQLAFPEAVNNAVYAVAPYAAKGPNTTKNANDGVFSDGDELQVATTAGDTTHGYVAALLIGI